MLTRMPVDRGHSRKVILTIIVYQAGIYPFHSIPSVRPLSIHPYCPSIRPFRSSTYLSVHLSAYLPIYLPIYLAIYLSIHPSIEFIYFHTTLQSLGCMWIEDSRKNTLQSKEGYRGYRQQEALRNRSHACASAHIQTIQTDCPACPACPACPGESGEWGRVGRVERGAKVN